MADIIEFLEARINEAESAARQQLSGGEPGTGVTGWCDPGRVLAECAAKRKILGNVPLVADVPTETGGTSEYVLMCLASVHQDHPDYEEGWAVDGL
ncbi:hypothetical protein J7E83_14445 [Arthrobacter sp. ISL-48]|uniref:DUF6221 family protein n=1 Tax=Arthrobacter sp. ISL-48 TaxID=2819110 RepID=UPI001BE8715A|nr:DUF6221 family protein [Arthrobacter sp. ISL-48]MBT2533296.1 hypothetical protein [Arthrobacter sp. ISL-48]